MRPKWSRIQIRVTEISSVSQDEFYSWTVGLKFFSLVDKLPARISEETIGLRRSPSNNERSFPSRRPISAVNSRNTREIHSKFFPFFRISEKMLTFQRFTKKRSRRKKIELYYEIWTISPKLMRSTLNDIFVAIRFNLIHFNLLMFFSTLLPATYSLIE